MATNCSHLGSHIGCILDTAVYAAVVCLVLAARQPLWGFARCCWAWYTRDAVRMHIMQEPMNTIALNSNQLNCSALACRLCKREEALAVDRQTNVDTYCFCSCCCTISRCVCCDRGNISHSLFKMFSVTVAQALPSKLRSHFTAVNSECQVRRFCLFSQQRLQETLQEDQSGHKHCVQVANVQEFECSRPIHTSVAQESQLDLHDCPYLVLELAEGGIVQQDGELNLYPLHCCL